MRFYGTWPDGERVWAEHPEASLLLVGHCLARPADLRDGLAAALERDEPRLLMDWPGAYAGLLLRHRGEVIAFTDLAGQFPLYYTSAPDELAIAAHPEVLTGPRQRALDRVMVAARIACPAVLPLWENRSPFETVARMPGGAVLRGRPGEVRLSPPLLRAADLDEVDALRVALTEAVALRCADGPVSADFSGGLDSTSLAFLAARHTSVEAVVYHHPQVPAADLAEAVSFSHHDERIHLSTVQGSQDTLPYAALPQQAGRTSPGQRGAEPTRGSLAVRRAMLRLRHAKTAETRLHITGEGGDAIFGAAPSYLGELARHGHLRRLARHCAGQAALRHTSTLALAMRAGRLALTSPVAALARLSRRLLRPDQSELTWPDAIAWWPVDGAVLTWLTPLMRAELAEAVRDPGLAECLAPDGGPAQMAMRTELRLSAESQRHLRDLGALDGIRVHAPFLDNAVVAAGLAVPSGRRGDPFTSKPLLAAALRGLVPQAVFRRRTKGDYSAEEYHGARVAARHLYALLDDSRLVAMGIIAAEPVRACLGRLLAGAPVPLGAMSQLFATENWLRCLENPFDWS
ncbi:putative asparagine synthetase [[Actinomadura] parvosata subsp. kistnae]|uniref:Asparagine synthetase domain-containing protein n=1 Tax=[Actinomadura] parvosata subsp. kistnae TaxID=1909395 RepID=A0A1U9ZT50_9ACTN|nr:asparagine synthase-related protein [Nonomuraea sp. ATCC 55076]AQZ61099.1 hypothetical protein BKM31_06000 [Nonomuraea sp. ATCC 55076]SPL87528.1 putative asparagine synthetase [Actinomadura parvosata subsp. kistnae]